MGSRTDRNIAGFFDFIASTYSADEQAVPRLLAAALDPARLNGSTVADLGCGTGAGTVWLAQHAARVAAIDLSGRSLQTGAALARRAGCRNILFARGDLTQMPLAPGTFAVAVSVGALPYLADEAAALARCLTLLRPDGELIVTLMRRTAGTTLLAAVRRCYALLPLSLARGLARLIVMLGRPLFTRLLKRNDTGPGGTQKSLEQTFLETFATPLPVHTTTVAAVRRAVAPLGFGVEQLPLPDSAVASTRTVLLLRLRRR